MTSYQDLLILGDIRGNIVIWNLKKQQQISQLHGHTKQIDKLLFDAKRKLLYSYSQDALFKSWNLKNNNEIHSYWSSHIITCIVLKHNQLYCGSQDGLILNLHLSDKNVKSKVKCIVVYEQNSPISSICVFKDKHNNDSDYLVTGSNDGNVSFYQNDNFILKTTKHYSIVKFICSCKEQLFSGCIDGKIIQWDVQNQYPLFEFNYFNQLNDLLFVDDHLLAISSNKTVIFWNIIKKEKLFELPKFKRQPKLINIVQAKLITIQEQEEQIRIWIQQKTQSKGQLFTDFFSALSHSENKDYPTFKSYEKINCSIQQNNQIFYAGTYGGFVKWDMSNIMDIKQVQKFIKQDNQKYITAMAISRQNHICNGRSNGIIVCWKNIDNKNYENIMTLQRHTDIVTSIIFTNTDNQKMISSSMDNQIFIWKIDMSNQIFEMEQQLIGHLNSVRAMCLTETTNVLCTAAINIRVWKLQNDVICQGFQLGMMKGDPHLDDITCLAIKGDDLLFSGSRDCTIKIWNINSFQLLKTLTGHKSFVTRIMITLPGQIVSGDDLGYVKQWFYNESSEAVKTDFCPSRVIGFLKIEHHKIIVISYYNIRILNLTVEINTLQIDNRINSVNCMIMMESEQSKYLVIGDRMNKIHLWNKQDSNKTFQKLNQLLGHTSSVNCLELNYKNQLISGSSDRSIKIWNVQQAKLIKSLNTHKGAVINIKVYQNKNGNFMVSGSDQQEIRIWDQVLYNNLISIDIQDTFYSCFTITNDQNLIFGNKDMTYSIWSIQKKQKIYQSFIVHKQAITCIDYLPQQANISLQCDLFATGSDDNLIKLFNYRDQTLIKTFTDHTQSITKLKFGLKGKYLYTGSQDMSIKVWNINGLKLTRSLYEDQNFGVITDFLITPQNEVIASTRDQVFGIFSQKTKKLIENQLYQNTNDQIIGIFQRQDKMINVVTREGKFSKWSLQNGQQLISEYYLDETIYDVVLITKIQSLVTLGEKNINIWDFENQNILFTIKYSDEQFQQMIITDDNQLVCAGRIISIYQNYDSSNPIKFNLIGQGDVDKITRMHYVTRYNPLNEEFIITATQSGILKCWSLDMNKKFHQLMKVETKQKINCFQYYFDSDDNLIVILANNYLNVWNMNTNSCMKILEFHLGEVTSLQIMKEKDDKGFEISKYLISACQLHRISITDLISFTQINQYEDEANCIDRIFLVNGIDLFTALKDGNIFLFKLGAMFYQQATDIQKFMENGFKQGNLDLCYKHSYYKLTILHMICYMQSNQKVEYLKDYLQHLIDKNIFLHITKDSFGKTALDILVDNKISDRLQWIQLLINYYDSFDILPLTYCECCFEGFKNLIFFGLQNHLSNCSSLFSKLKIKAYEDMITTNQLKVCSEFNSAIIFQDHRKILKQSDYEHMLPFKNYSENVNYHLSIIKINNLMNILDTEHLFLECMQNLEIHHPMFKNKVLDHILQIKWKSYARIYFILETINFYIYCVLFVLNINWKTFFTVNDHIMLTYFLIIQGLYFQYSHLNYIYHIGINRFLQSFWNYLATFNFNLALICHILSLEDSQQEDNQILKMLKSITILGLVFQSISYYRADENLSFFIKMLEEIGRNVQVFMIMLIQLIIGFALAMDFIIDDSKNIRLDNLIKIFYSLALGEFHDMVKDTREVESFQYLEFYHSFIFIISTFIMQIVLMNLLIAIISDSYASVVLMKKQSRNYELTRIIYEIEKTLSPFLRKKTEKLAKGYIYIIEKDELDNQDEADDDHQQQQLDNALQIQKNLLQDLDLQIKELKNQISEQQIGLIEIKEKLQIK